MLCSAPALQPAAPLVTKQQNKQNGVDTQPSRDREDRVDGGEEL